MFTFIVSCFVFVLASQRPELQPPDDLGHILAPTGQPSNNVGIRFHVVCASYLTDSPYILSSNLQGNSDLVLIPPFIFNSLSVLTDVYVYRFRCLEHHLTLNVVLAVDCVEPMPNLLCPSTRSLAQASSSSMFVC